MSRLLTRRSLASLVAAAAAAQTPQPPQPPPTNDEELAAARAAAKAWNEQIARTELPRAVEPAAHFKA